MKRFMVLVVLVMLLLLCCCDDLMVSADIGTASSYSPPYLPTRCDGYREDQFPEGGYFVAASEGVWNNGAACGRKYRMRCISGVNRPCRGGSIVVQVVDVCNKTPCPATLILSEKAFDAISRTRNAKINVEYAMI